MSVDGLRGRVFLRAFAGDRFAVVLMLEYTWILFEPSLRSACGGKIPKNLIGSRNCLQSKVIFFSPECWGEQYLLCAK